MKRINRTLRLLAVTAVALGTLLPTAPAQAITTVSVSPASQTIGVGGPATVNIIVSGLTQALGGFSFILGFNDTILSSNGYTPNPDNKMGVSPDDFSFGFIGGSLDVFYVADKSADEAALALAQSDSFTLATVSFLGGALGLSQLTLTDVVLSNFDGSGDIDDVGVSNGSICVAAAAGANGCAEVPEPGTLALLTLGMLGMGLTRRRRSN